MIQKGTGVQQEKTNERVSFKKLEQKETVIQPSYLPETIP